MLVGKSSYCDVLQEYALKCSLLQNCQALLKRMLERVTVKNPYSRGEYFNLFVHILPVFININVITQQLHL